MVSRTNLKSDTASGQALARAEHVPWILAAAEVHEWTSTTLASFCMELTAGFRPPSLLWALEPTERLAIH